MRRLFSLFFFGLRAIFFNGLLSIASLIKINIIWGSTGVFFSAINIAGPLVGFYGGMSSVILLHGIKSIVMHGALFPLTPLVYHIPTFCAAAYWARDSFLLRFVIPLLCFVLFVVHPVGASAVPFACYWVIPLVIYWLPARNTIFLQALGSTFVAHAVGSVLWLYCGQLSAEKLMALLPVVAVERLLFASGMTVVCYSVFFLKKLLRPWLVVLWQKERNYAASSLYYGWQ